MFLAAKISANEAAHFFCGVVAVVAGVAPVDVSGSDGFSVGVVKKFYGDFVVFAVLANDDEVRAALSLV